MMSCFYMQKCVLIISVCLKTVVTLSNDPDQQRRVVKFLKVGGGRRRRFPSILMNHDVELIS